MKRIFLPVLFLIFLSSFALKDASGFINHKVLVGSTIYYKDRVSHIPDSRYWRGQCHWLEYRNIECRFWQRDIFGNWWFEDNRVTYAVDEYPSDCTPPTDVIPAVCWNGTANAVFMFSGNPPYLDFERIEYQAYLPLVQ